MKSPAFFISHKKFVAAIIFVSSPRNIRATLSDYRKTGEALQSRPDGASDSFR
jgi:hypothetical protein